MLTGRIRRTLVLGAAFLTISAFAGTPARSADKNVNLDGPTGNESNVSTNVVTTSPVKIKNKVTNKAVGQAFRFNWPSAGPGGFSSEAGNASRPGSTSGVGAVWTWETTQQVFSFTGSLSCPNTNDICFTQTFPSGPATTRGPFGVPGRSLSASNVTVTNESLTSSLLSFFSPETELFHVTSSVEQFAPGVFRYQTNVTNLSGGSIVVHQPPSPLGCNPAECGNNVREGYEQCDGSDLGGYDCTSFGASGGTLACDGKCSFDFSGCTGYCGNGTAEGKELCDGADLDGRTCDNLTGGGGGGGSFASGGNPPGGSLGCTSTCGLDLTNCTNVCGNGLAEPDAQTSEQCDGSDLGGGTCENKTKGGHGHLSCGSDCQWDTSECTCGNGTREAFEQCEGSDLGGADCESFPGGTGGTLGCTELCTYDVQGCTGVCGNGVREGSEQCEGTDFGGADCVSEGGTGNGKGGGLICDADCTINTSNCEGMCGNGVRNDGEECDGADIGGAVCSDPGSLLASTGSGRGERRRLERGLLGGNLPACDSSCHLDYSVCNIPCEVGDQDATVNDGGTVRTRCEVSNHPAKEITGQIMVCGSQIPSGEPCGGGSEGATFGTHNLFVPDTTITIGEFYFTPIGVEVLDGGDGLAKPGETVDLRIKIINAGSMDAHGVMGTISFPPQDLDGDGGVGPHETITVVNATASFPDSCMTGFPAGSADCTSAEVPVEGCASAAPHFRISIPSDFPVDVAPVFTLTLTYPPPVLAPAVRTDGPGRPGTAVHPSIQAAGLSFPLNIVMGIVGNYCGDGILDPNEDCDDGNAVDGDCCSSRCSFETSGSPCNDGQACTLEDHCNAAGVCSGAPKQCGEQEPCSLNSCNPATGRCEDEDLPDGTPCHADPPLAELGLPGGCNGTGASVCRHGECVPSSPRCPIGFVEADTTVRQYRPTTNFGRATELDADSSPQAQALVRFRLAGTSGHPVSRVLLKVYTPKTASSAGRIHATRCGWSENVVTWNTRPSLGGSFVPMGSVVNGSFYTYDITSLQQFDHDGTYCIGIDNLSGDADLASREAKVGRPQIVLETQCPCTPVVGEVIADATVVKTSPYSNFGNAPLITVDYSPLSQTFIKVKVEGVGSRHVDSARLRLKVGSHSSASSDSGGQIRLVPSSQCGWTEMGITYNNRPTSAGSSLSSVGSVAANQLVEFDLKSTIPGDGTYCYRLESSSSNNADYNSLQGAAPRPELVLVVKP